mmetsp:Transcript_43111/g.90559  ORF Transcript_43111/g.90559 Transcript_43111/m.90559 type:complete len:269 (-) Transcript_43111:97-903(-)
MSSIGHVVITHDLFRLVQYAVAVDVVLFGHSGEPKLTHVLMIRVGGGGSREHRVGDGRRSGSGSYHGRAIHRRRLRVLIGSITARLERAASFQVVLLRRRLSILERSRIASGAHRGGTVGDAHGHRIAIATAGAAADAIAEPEIVHVLDGTLQLCFDSRGRSCGMVDGCLAVDDGSRTQISGGTEAGADPVGRTRFLLRLLPLPFVVAVAVVVVIRQGLNGTGLEILSASEAHRAYILYQRGTRVLDGLDRRVRLLLFLVGGGLPRIV